MPYWNLFFLLGSLLPLALGCAGLMSDATANLMVQAPNRVDPRIRTAYRRAPKQDQTVFDERFWVPVGPPPARLLVSVIDARPRAASPCGTLLVLHGAYGRSENMLPAAAMFASEGYRTVLVDLRGHGQSTGERITYGVQESKDVSQVIDVLQQRNLLAGNLGVYGFSYGAATALQLAGRDRRVRAVVAVAPFSSLEEAAKHLARTRLPGARRYATDQWVNRTLSKAGRQGGFDFHQANPAAEVGQTDAMVLLIHGTADDFIEPRHSTELYRAAYGHARLVFIEGADHDDLSRDAQGLAASQGVSWFNQWLRSD